MNLIKHFVLKRAELALEHFPVGVGRFEMPQHSALLSANEMAQTTTGRNQTSKTSSKKRRNANAQV